MKKIKKKLTILFYLLMRDAYPTGQFRSILLKSLNFNLKNKIKFSSKELELLSKRYVKDFTKDKKLKFSPDWVSPPGDTIKDVIEEKGISIERLAESLNIPIGKMDCFLDGKTRITKQYAKVLSKISKVPENFWINRDLNYVDDCKRLGIKIGERTKKKE